MFALIASLLVVSPAHAVPLPGANGIGGVASATALAGGAVAIEAVRLNGELGVFCAPTANLVTDLELHLGANAIRTVGCRDVDHYQGTFLTLNLSASAEALGLPVGAGIGLNVGLHTGRFMTEFAEAVQNGSIDTQALMAELAQVAKSPSSLTSGRPETRLARVLSILVIDALLSESDLAKVARRELQRTLKLVRDPEAIELALRSLPSEIEKLRTDLLGSSLVNSARLLKIALESLSGCNSVNVGASWSLSLTPVSAGFSVSIYASMLRLDPGEDFGSGILGELATFAATFPQRALNACVLSQARHLWQVGKDLREIYELEFGPIRLR